MSSSVTQYDVQTSESVHDCRMIDIAAPAHGVDIGIDLRRGVLWVNVDGVCALRVCQIPKDENGQPFLFINGQQCKEKA